MVSQAATVANQRRERPSELRYAECASVFHRSTAQSRMQPSHGVVPGNSSRARVVTPSLRATARDSFRTRRTTASTGYRPARSSACGFLCRPELARHEARRGSVKDRRLRLGYRASRGHGRSRLKGAELRPTVWRYRWNNLVAARSVKATKLLRYLIYH